MGIVHPESSGESLIPVNPKPYEHVLCTSCAAILPVGAGTVVLCTVCGSRVEVLPESDVYRYAEAAIRYGYQYRTLFEKQQRAKGSPKFHLNYIGEAFTFVAIAAISGVIGNFAYDVIKTALRRIRDQTRDKADTRPDYRRLSELTDEDLDTIFDYLKAFVEGLSSLEKTIRDDIIEEMVADNMGNAVMRNPELLTIFKKNPISKKEKAKVVGTLVAEARSDPQYFKPTSARFLDFWGHIEK